MFVTSTLHFVWCYYFVFTLDMKVDGVCLATVITYFLNFAVITIWCMKDS